MSPIILTLKERPKVPLEAETVTPDAFVTMSNAQIRESLVYHGKRHCRLDDFFDVTGEYSDDIEMHGDLHQVKLLGKSMSRGQLKIHGSVGMHLGADMRGGRIEVTGDAGDWIGGNAQWLYPCARQRRRTDRSCLSRELTRNEKRNHHYRRHGWFGSRHADASWDNHCGGKVRDFCGLQMKGGTIVLMSGAEIRTGAWMVRGTILSLQPLPLMPTFVASGHYNPSFIDLYARELRTHGITLPNNPSVGNWARHCGDTSIPGRGEILIWNPANQIPKD